MDGSTRASALMQLACGYNIPVNIDAEADRLDSPSMISSNACSPGGSLAGWTGPQGESSGLPEAAAPS